MAKAPRPAPEFSVVVRCYNRRDRVLDAIDSVLRQSHRDFEVIVVDDASTDGSADQVAERFGADPKVRLVYHHRNRGAAAAANTGVAEARGRLIAFLDSDDLFLEDCLSAHGDALANAPHAAMSYCDYIQIWQPHGLERVMACGRDVEDQRLRTLQGGFIHSQSLTVLRREALAAAGPFDETLTISHDFDLWMRLALAHEQPFIHVQKPLVRYALSVDGVTKRYERWWQEAKTVLARGKEHAAAAPYLDILTDVDKRVGANILARSAVEHWIGQVREQPISVVVPAIGAADRLAGALTSVREQTATASEVLIVTDRRHRVAARAAADAVDDPRVTVIDVSRDLGPGDALMLGLKIARGPLVALLDPADRWDPDYLHSQLRANSFPAEQPVFTYADSRQKDAHGRTVALPHRHAWRTTDPHAEYIENPYPHGISGLVLRSDVIGGLGLDSVSNDQPGADLAGRCLAWLAGETERRRLGGAPVRIARPLVERIADLAAGDRPC